jgi:hypothetical protein
MDKLSGTERRDLRALHANNVLAVLPADKSNATVVLNTKAYEKITTLLRAPTYRRLPKDPTEERKTTVLLKRLSHSEDGVAMGSSLSLAIAISWSTLKKWLWRQRPTSPSDGSAT